MSNAYSSLKINPFTDDVVTEPRAVSFSVAGLNEKPIELISAVFEKLDKEKLPRAQIKAEKAQLVVSPDRGYGKSHLLGRLFQFLGERATQIYLRPFQDSQKAWNSILLTTIQELERPNQHGIHDESQLEAFAMGVVAHLAADFLTDAGNANDAGLQLAVDYLRDHPLKALGRSRPNEVLIDWIKSCLESEVALSKLAGLLRRRGVVVHGKEKAWLKVLAGYAFAESDSVERDAALKWLRAEPLETEEVEALKLTTADNDAPSDSSAQEINDLSLRRLTGLCVLSSYYRPFLFCFDQTEFYGSDKTLVGALGRCVETLHAAIPNQLTVVTTNANNWLVEIRPFLESGHQNRFSEPINIEGINSDQARELIVRRLTDFQISSAAVSEFVDADWLAGHFEVQPQLGVRDLLMKAAERFRVLAKSTTASRAKASIAELFAVETNNVSAKRALHQYNQDCLMWFVQVLAQGYDGVSVERPKERYFSVQWDWTDRSVYFAFEGGDHHARWGAIAREAMTMRNRSSKKIKSIVFRSPDLKPIPRQTWGRAKQEIANAIGNGFNIVSLDLLEVCELHAGRELYSNALQGNLDHAAPEVLKWLKTKFAPWLKKYSCVEAESNFSSTSPPSSKRDASASDDPPTKRALTELTQGELNQVVTFVRVKKLVDIKEVLQELGRESLREALLLAVERNPNLKAHSGPQTIYLQWRISV